MLKRNFIVVVGWGKDELELECVEVEATTHKAAQAKGLKAIKKQLSWANPKCRFKVISSQIFDRENY